MAAKIKKGDKVVVLTGRDKGRTGEVIAGAAEGRAARSCAASTSSSATSARRRRQEGGIISKEAPIHLSNIALADPKDGKPTRVGFKILDDGRKVRVAKRSGELDRWLTPRTKRAAPEGPRESRRREDPPRRAAKAAGRGGAAAAEGARRATRGDGERGIADAPTGLCRRG